jgi:Na+/melibiose symporter-like transporter
MMLPESHVWLITKEKQEDALDALKWFRGDKYHYESEHLATLKYHEDTKKGIGSWRDFLKFHYLKPVLIICACMLLRHFCGNTAIMFFMSQIFEMSKSGVQTRYAVIALGTVQLVFIVISGQMMDKLGRKKSTVISGVVMGLAQAGMGAYFFLDESPHLKHLAAQ